MNASTPSVKTLPSQLRLGRLLLTGAAGGLGQVLRQRLKPYCEVLRLSDIAPMAEAGPGEEVVQADLADAQAVHALLAGVDAVAHFGGISVETPWDPILQANIIGAKNLYEAARVQGVRRIVFASSNHVVGMYGQNEVLDVKAAPRPDGFYGLSKAFGENLSRLYFDRHGIETACLRIGSCTPEPTDRRMLSTWLSHADLERLVMACLRAPVLGHTIVYGCSDNASSWWDNRGASHIGYRPQDSSEPWRAEVEARQPHIDLSDPTQRLQGGRFVTIAPQP